MRVKQVTFLICPLAKERIPALLDRKVDVLFSRMNPERDTSDKISFSKPYLYDGISILSAENAVISEATALSGKRIAVTTGSPAETYLAANAAGVTLVKSDNDEAAFEALKSGKADGMAAESYTLAWLAAKNSGFKLGLPLLGDKYELVAAVRKEDQELLERINFMLDWMRNGQLLKEQYLRNMGDAVEKLLPPDLMLPR